jgi:hypothetical protein
MTKDQIDSVVRLHEWSSKAGERLERAEADADKLREALVKLLAVSTCFCGRIVECYRCKALAVWKESDAAKQRID